MNNFPNHDNNESDPDAPPSGDWYEDNPDDVLAPPPSLADIDEDEDIDDAATVNDYDSMDEDDQEGPSLTTYYQILGIEMLSIQHDLENLIGVLNGLIQRNSAEIESRPSCVYMAKTRPYLLDDELTGVRSLNWDTFGPIINEIISDLEHLRNLNLRTNDLLRRMRTIAALEEPMKHYPFKLGETVSIVPNKQVPLQCTKSLQVPEIIVEQVQQGLQELSCNEDTTDDEELEEDANVAEDAEEEDQEPGMELYFDQAWEMGDS